MEAAAKRELKKVLRRTLKNLNPSDFKEFKHCLRDKNEQDESKIPWITLQDADTTTTVDLIVNVYVSDSGDVVVSTLLDADQNDLAKTLEKDLEGIFPDRAAKNGNTTTAVSEKGKDDTQKDSVAGNEGNAASADSGMGEGQKFFIKHKKALEARLPLLDPILGELEHRGFMTSLEREDIATQPTRSKRNHALLCMLENRGDEAQKEFYKILQEVDKYLVNDLMKKEKK